MSHEPIPISYPQPITFIVKGNLLKKQELIGEIGSVFKDYPFQILETLHQGHAIQLAKDALEVGNFLLIAMGGDGTINEVANGVLQALVHLNAEAQNKVRIGVLSFGTGNDFARTLGVNRNLLDLKVLITKDRTKLVRPGKVTCKNENDEMVSRYFINVADIGLGAAVVDRMRRSYWLGAMLTYQLAIIRTLFSYKNPVAEIHSERRKSTNKMMSLVVAKGNYFGNALGIAPHASINENELACVLLGDVSIFEYLRYLPQVFRSKKITHKEVHYFKTNRIKVNHQQRPIPVEADGEFIGYSPVDFEQTEFAISFYA